MISLSIILMRSVLLWRVTMACYYGVLLWRVTMACYYGVLLWRVIL